MVPGGDKKNIPLAVAALGVVFGDIGTSPLYAFETALRALGEPSPHLVLGVASLIIWTLLLIVSLKYILVVMRADYHGEGGVFALLALLQNARRNSRLKLPFYVLLLLFGAALLFGDGTITPAISVLSAMEGLEAVNPGLAPLILPCTVGILVVLFSVQHLGTGRLGMVFGWVMLLWFLVIGAMGLWWVVRQPEVLVAFNPLLALEMLWDGGWLSFAVMGAVVLVVTGAEALYADLGHFNRRAIALAWHGVALPALVLNYLGQAALAISDPAAFQTRNPFFHMVPSGGFTVALVVLATVATVIASQALISGVFSLTAQAQELQYFPRFLVRHTSGHERGQVYVPITNFFLAVACIFLVLTFRSSENLAAAYGLAVVGTMVITTFSMGLVTNWCWHWRRWQTLVVMGAFLALEIPFLVACLIKIPEGAYFPLLLGGGLFVLMLTWHHGRNIILQHMKSRPCSESKLSKLLEDGTTLSAPGQLVFITASRDPLFAVARAFEMLRRGGGLREQVVLMSLVSSMESDVDMPRSISVREIGPHLWHVTALHGYRQEPHAPEILAVAHKISEGRIGSGARDTFFVLGRELIVEYVGQRMARWRRALFGFMSRNVSNAPDYYFIPHAQMIVFTWMMRA
jgi:KUP system potassium uptake protein